MQKMTGYFKNLFVDTWTNTENLSLEYNASSHKKLINGVTIAILVYIAFGLSVVKYYGNTDTILMHAINFQPSAFGDWFCTFFYAPQIGEFHKKMFWICMIVLFYLIIPMLITKFGFKHRLRDYGLSFKNIHKDYPLYLLMMAVMLPIVYIASSTASFQARYPIFQPESGSLFPFFLWWQIAYFIQFVAVEFFFRGFILHGLKHRFGMYAIFISTIPYCMVHFGKPFGETISAIFAGIILGTLSLKSRSIVLGILIHYSVAITMDLFALYREGLLG